MKSAKVIVLVQNDPYLVSTRTTLLAKQGYVVKAVHTVEESRQLCHDFSCDLVIVDSEEDYKAAIQLCEEIKTENPEVNVAVIAWHGSEIDSECPDEVIRRDRGPQEFVEKVRLALA